MDLVSARSSFRTTTMALSTSLLMSLAACSAFAMSLQARITRAPRDQSHALFHYLIHSYILLSNFRENIFWIGLNIRSNGYAVRSNIFHLCLSNMKRRLDVFLATVPTPLCQVLRRLFPNPSVCSSHYSSFSI